MNEESACFPFYFSSFALELNRGLGGEMNAQFSLLSFHPRSTVPVLCLFLLLNLITHIFLFFHSFVLN